MDTDTAMYLWWLVFNAIAGALIGRLRGRPLLGMVLGLLLSVFGWIIVFLLPDHQPRCPECGMKLPIATASKCLKCGATFGPSMIPPPPPLR